METHNNNPFAGAESPANYEQKCICLLAIVIAFAFVSCQSMKPFSSYQGKKSEISNCDLRKINRKYGCSIVVPDSGWNEKKSTLERVE